MIHEKQETNEVGTKIASLYCFGIVFGKQQTEVTAQWNVHIKKKKKKKKQVCEFSGRKLTDNSTREELSRQRVNLEDLWRVCLGIQQSADHNECVRTTGEAKNWTQLRHFHFQN